MIRPRIIVYAAALAGVSGLMVWGLMNRAPLVVHVIRDRNPTFVRLHDGAVRNGYVLKIANRGFETRTLQIAIEGLPGAMLKTPGEAATRDVITAQVEANDVRAVRLLVSAPPGATASQPMAFVATGDGPAVRTPSVFLSGDDHGSH